MQLPSLVLFVPADRPDRFARAASEPVDAVIIDLEDAVPPGGKEAARGNLLNRSPLQRQTMVRINAADSPWFKDDLEALRAAPPDAVVLPKASLGDGLDALAEALPQVPRIVLVETARGLDDLGAMLARPGVIGCGIGHLDLALDLGCAPDWEAMLFARSLVVLRSRLAGLSAPLDGVTTDFRDAAAVRDDARRAKALGFGGKLLIHPAQVAPAREAFAPSPAERQWAERIMAAAEAAGAGAIELDGAMVDKPVVMRAARLLGQPLPG
jgi:citrate lyase subunit beta/citryl-CoA lyase